MGEGKKEVMQMCEEECSGQEKNTCKGPETEQERQRGKGVSLQSEHGREDQMMSDMKESRLGGGIKDTGTTLFPPNFERIWSDIIRCMFYFTFYFQILFTGQSCVHSELASKSLCGRD